MSKEDITEPCKSCKGKCCMGIIDVEPHDVVFNDSSLTRNFRGKRIMILNKRYRCIALEDGICSIHEKKPSICRNVPPYSSYCKAILNDMIKLCV